MVLDQYLFRPMLIKWQPMLVQLCPSVDVVHDDPKINLFQDIAKIRGQ